MTIDEARQRYEDAKKRVIELGRTRQDRERKIEKLEGEAEAAALEARSTELLPGEDGGTATKSRARERVATLRSEIEELEASREEAIEERDEALETFRDAVAEEIPGLLEEVKAAGEEEADAYSDMAEKVLPLLGEVLQARKEKRTARQELDRALADVSLGSLPDDEDRARSRQKGQIRKYLKEANRNRAPAEIIGHAIAEALDELRSGNSPVADYFAERGVPTGGSSNVRRDTSIPLHPKR